MVLCGEKHYGGEYIRLLLDGELNHHLHEVDEECHARMEQPVEQMKWVGLMNNVRGAAEEVVITELIYV